MSRMNQRLDLELLGEKFSVFDLQTSFTAQYVNDDIEKKDPFAGLSDPKCIIDVGANVGVVSFLAATRWPNCQVYAIEPHPTNLSNLIKGVEYNNLKNVTVMGVGVGYRFGFEKFALEEGNSGSSSSYPNGFRMFPKDWPMISAEAFCVRLDDVVEPLARKFGGSIDFMKVDIEGGEFMALQSFTFWNAIKRLHVELHPFNLPRSKEEAIAVEKEFSDFLRHYMKHGEITIIGPNWDDEKGTA